MKNLAWIIHIAILLALPVSLSAMPLVDIEAAIGGWQQSPSGYFSYDSDDRLDLESLLNYQDEKQLFGRLKIDMPLVIPNIYLMASPMEFQEKAVTDYLYRFGDLVVPPGVWFQSKLVLDQYDVGLYYDIPLLKTATLNRLNIELGLNARIYDAEASVATIPPPVGVDIDDLELTDILDEYGQESEQETILVPMIYLGIQIQPIEKLAFEGEFRGATYQDSDLYSLIGRVKVKAIGPFFFGGGYRYEAGDSHDWDLEFDVDFEGPFLEAGVSF